MSYANVTMIKTIERFFQSSFRYAEGRFSDCIF